VGLFDEGDHVIGGLAFQEARRFGLRVARNLPLTPVVGPFLDVTASNPVTSQTRVKQAGVALCEWFEAAGHAVVSVGFDRSWRDLQPFAWSGYHVTPTYTYLLDLGRSDDELWARLSSDRRKAVRKAAKDGIEVQPTFDAARVLALVRATFRRQRLAFHEAVAAAALRDFLAPGRGFAFVATRDGVDLATVFCLADRATATYLLGGYDEAHRHGGAGALAMWEAIRHARALGLATYDFEGSSVPAIEQYFRGFGGELTPGWRVSKAWLPLELGLKLVRRGLF